MVVNVRAGGVREGGSTITQQLAKTAFLTNDRSMARKGRELLIALWLEAWLTKDEVLGRYLSSVYYGDGQYGLRAASRGFDLVAEHAPPFETGPRSRFVSSAVNGLIGDRLRPTSDATTIRVRSGELLVTDGPFTESKEWIVGFDILECDDLDEAIEIASKHPVARSGRIEIRPFWDEDDD